MECYECTRIVSIGYCHVKNFTFDYLAQMSLSNINEQIVKPKGFIIPDDSIKIHGITNQEANTKGKKIVNVLKNIGKIIKSCDYIIGYNIFYDINILLSELYRINKHNTIQKILQMIADKKILCLGQISSKEATPIGWIKYSNYQIPKQTDVYKHCFNKQLENAHSAKYDVFGMMQILGWIYENKIKSKNN